MNAPTQFGRFGTTSCEVSLKSRSTLSLVILSALLSGCGGSDLDKVTLASQQTAVRAQQQTVPTLDVPLTNREIQKAVETPTGLIGSQHKQSALIANGAHLAIDTGDREAVRLFFNKVYVQPDVPMEWNGDYRTGNAGGVSPAYQNATVQRIAWYRAMAGLPTVTGVSAVNSAKAQQAALMMSVNGQLSHKPPSTWRFFTADGAEAAAASNLALSSNGPTAIDNYISDAGDNNYFVGHRRWIFHPKTRTFGIGDVPAATVDGTKLWGANVLWVSDTDLAGARPAVRDDFVAWPTRGYVPYAVVYSRWSISYPNADFAQAKVSVSRDGAVVPTSIEKVEAGYGENTLVWQTSSVPTGSRHERPSSDIRYHVVVSNVFVGQQARSFEYDVIVFDPSVATPGATKPQITAPAIVRAGSTYTVQAATTSNVTGYDLLSYRRKSLTQIPSSDYNSVSWTVGSRNSSGTLSNGTLNLYEDGQSSVPPQTAVLNKKLYVSQAGGAISLLRSAGNAMSSQSFHVQVSTDDGSSWTDVYSEAGRGLTQTPASMVQVSLSAYSGRLVRLRMIEDYSGSAYIGPSTGWTISSITFSGVDELVDEQEFQSTNGNFSLTAAQPGSFVLVPRVQYQSMYFSDGGVPALVAIDGAVLHGQLSSYTITKAKGVLTIRDNVGQDGTQTVQGPFRLDFTDVSLAFDVDGNAGQAYRLYRAAFNRKPDSSGLGFWINAMDGGFSIEAMAQGFATSAEFADLYGASPTNTEVIKALYTNVLHRTPDEAGAQYWHNQMASGMSVERLLVAFSESKENKDQVAPEVELGIAFTRR
jgi:hypothetical protein